VGGVGGTGQASASMFGGDGLLRTLVVVCARGCRRQGGRARVVRTLRVRSPARFSPDTLASDGRASTNVTDPPSPLPVPYNLAAEPRWAAAEPEFACRSKVASRRQPDSWESVLTRPFSHGAWSCRHRWRWQDPCRRCAQEWPMPCSLVLRAYGFEFGERGDRAALCGNCETTPCRWQRD